MKLYAKAFLFDLNGTLINDMAYHLDAWFGILNDDLEASLSRDAVKREMYGKNSELLIRVFGENRFTPLEMEQWSTEKEKRYQKAFQPNLKTIAGLEAFLETAAHAGIRMAIGSAAINRNIDFVLDGLRLRQYFSAIVSADDVAHSKPDPETFLKAAHLLGVSPEDCIVFEDAPKGVEAAKNAGMQAVVLTTMHNAAEFAVYKNIIAFVEDYNSTLLHGLIERPVAF